MLGLQDADSGAIALDKVGKLPHLRDVLDGGTLKPTYTVAARKASLPARKAYGCRETLIEPTHEITKCENVLVAKSALASQPVCCVYDAVELLRLGVSVGGNEADEHKAP